MERDRIAVHLIWEAVLAVVAVALIVGTLALTTDKNLTVAWQVAGYVGLIAAGLAFSLRTGSPNLAVGAITGFTAIFAAHLYSQGWGKTSALLVAVVLAGVIGLVLGAVTGLLSVPAWAVTLAAATGLQALTLQISNLQTIPMPFSGSYPTALWFGLFLVVSIGGGLLWLLVPNLRTALGAGRRTGEPGQWAGLPGVMSAAIGLTGSSVLAGVAAIPLLMRVQAADVNSATTLLPLVFAAVLLGGVSIFGRRAGIAGTALAVVIVTITQTLLTYNSVSIWVQYLVVALTALTGLVVSRVLESVTDALNT